MGAAALCSTTPRRQPRRHERGPASASNRSCRAHAAGGHPSDDRHVGDASDQRTGDKPLTRTREVGAASNAHEDPHEVIDAERRARQGPAGEPDRGWHPDPRGRPCIQTACREPPGHNCRTDHRCEEPNLARQPKHEGQTETGQSGDRRGTPMQQRRPGEGARESARAEAICRSRPRDEVVATITATCASWTEQTAARTLLTHIAPAAVGWSACAASSSTADVCTPGSEICTVQRLSAIRAVGSSASLGRDPHTRFSRGRSS